MPEHAIVVEIDDTLTLERYYVRSGLEAVGAWAHDTLGVSGVAEVAWGAFVDGRWHEALTTAMRVCGAPASRDVIREAADVYRSHRPRIRLEDDAFVFLNRAVERGPLAIVTSGDPAMQKAKAHALGLARWAHTIVYTGDYGGARPRATAAAFDVAARKLGFPQSRCSYVAAHPGPGFSTAKSLGWQTVRLRRAGSLRAAIESPAEIDCEVPSLDHLEWAAAGLSRRRAQPVSILAVRERSSPPAATGGM